MPGLRYRSSHCIQIPFVNLEGPMPFSNPDAGKVALSIYMGVDDRNRCRAAHRQVHDNTLYGMGAQPGRQARLIDFTSAKVYKDGNLFHR